ncbi:MAG: helix-turn-helix transcriptional regulator [Candidatus Kerfeldbacteria bacterium]|nr:helix-turn-helix transcriptional regulator [Candidatus Kerfeldbacteria bacterium]
MGLPTISGISEKIKHARAARGWSQGKLSEAIGVSRRTICRWEAGTDVPTLVNIHALTRTFGASIDLFSEVTPTSSEVDALEMALVGLFRLLPARDQRLILDVVKRISEISSHE